MRSRGTMLSTSVQADRQGPSITTRSPEFAHLLEQVDERADLAAGTCEDAHLGARQHGREEPQRDREQQGEDDAQSSLMLVRHPFRRWPRSVGRPMPAASKPPSTAKICPVM